MTTEAAPARHFAQTARRDRWWVAPVLTGSGLTAFGIYSIVVAAMGSDYLYTGGGARYLSPFYSPDLKSWGLHISFTYAFFVIWVPLGFRLSCYYYRKAYYRAFFLAPPACAVAVAHRRRYRGETRFPFVLLNIHRFFFYLATIVLVFLCYDTVRGVPVQDLERIAGVRRRSRVAGDARKRGPAHALHIRLQLASPPDRRPARLLHVLCGGADAPPALASRDSSSTTTTCCGPGSAWSASA